MLKLSKWKQKKMSKVLIVAAHPDDEILGCGGTILKRIIEGDDIYCLVLGEGISARYEKRGLIKKEKIGELRRLHLKVSKFMGFKKNWLYNFPDNRFDAVDLLDVIKVIEKIKKMVQPKAVYTHFENDLNIDHKITFQAVLTACRPVAGETVREIFSFEIPSSTEWVSPFSNSNYFRPNVFVNIENTIDKKIETMKLYKNELKRFPHPRALKSVRIIAQRWGMFCGLNYAEPFMLIRKIE